MARCSVKISGGGTWGSFHQHQCHRNAVVERDEQPFCKIHDPVEVEKRRKERDKKWSNQWAKEREDLRRLQAMHKTCQDIPTEVLETINVKDLLKSVQEKENKLEELLKVIKERKETK